MGSLLGGIVITIFSQGIHSLSAELAIAGLVCYAAVLAIALTTNVRINKQIANFRRFRPEAPPHFVTDFAIGWE